MTGAGMTIIFSRALEWEGVSFRSERGLENMIAETA
jgi:hypothetical protein